MKNKGTTSKKEQDSQTLEKLFPEVMVFLRCHLNRYQEGATEAWSIYKTSGYSVEKTIKLLCRGNSLLYEKKMEEFKQSRITKKTPTQVEEVAPKKTGKTAEEVYSRLQWDEHLNKEETTIGYEDRFIGIQEIPFEQFAENRDLVGEVFIPWHRIRYFRTGDEVIWSRQAPLVAIPADS
ncbi:hypothetical protein PROFUN_13216 [Planoprotostelium fungivorum]|uniref:MJ1316 RNA cyclic group end recognition domain-containing protein n=1 Tax=Planoprotostelium fungivorum TaxID=1890364 RepID=A0A2P6MYU2_9EUKA|nr:hypothetical protein PROFUN_13216 [Planoprotostelium fungivorum]